MLENQHRQLRKLKKQRNTLQISKLDKTSKIFNEIKISNLPDKKFKVIVIKIVTDLGERIM